jgi:hypothetical protein
MAITENTYLPSIYLNTHSHMCAIFNIKLLKLSRVLHACNLSTWKTEVGQCQVQGQLMLHSEDPVSENKTVIIITEKIYNSSTSYNGISPSILSPIWKNYN